MAWIVICVGLFALFLYVIENIKALFRAYNVRRLAKIEAIHETIDHLLCKAYTDGYDNCVQEFVNTHGIGILEEFEVDVDIVDYQLSEIEWDQNIIEHYSLRGKNIIEDL